MSVLFVNWKIVISVQLSYKCSRQTAYPNIDGLVQEKCNSSALAKELRFFFTNPSICVSTSFTIWVTAIVDWNYQLITLSPSNTREVTTHIIVTLQADLLSGQTVSEHNKKHTLTRTHCSGLFVWQTVCFQILLQTLKQFNGQLLTIKLCQCLEQNFKTTSSVGQVAQEKSLVLMTSEGVRNFSKY